MKIRYRVFDDSFVIYCYIYYEKEMQRVSKYLSFTDHEIDFNVFSRITGVLSYHVKNGNITKHIVRECFTIENGTFCIGKWLIFQYKMLHFSLENKT